MQASNKGLGIAIQHIFHRIDIILTFGFAAATAPRAALT